MIPYIRVMEMAIFTKKIRCLHCGGNFKRRKNRKKYAWICSRRENGYTNCPRVQLDEDFLISVIERRYQRKLSTEEIIEKVEKIEVEDKLLFKIYLKDQEPIIYGRKQIIY